MDEDQEATRRAASQLAKRRAAMSPLRAALLAGFVLVGGALPLAPRAEAVQVVRGRLVETGDARPVGGAMVTLVAPGGVDAARSLSRDSGLFELVARAPGEYWLRAERIGYATTLSDPFRLVVGDTLSIRLEASVEAISLEGIQAEGDRRCRVRPDEGLAVTQVWDEARKALAAAAWTQDRGMYQYEMRGVTRQLDREGRRILSESRAYQQGYRKAPFVSRPADSLVAEGFARLTARESVYWAPDADVLLSDAFLDTHCFRLRDDPDGAPGLIGLAFEPVPRRRVPEIGGTLWVDSESAELRWLEFDYRNLGLPDVLMRSSPGGRVEFKALPNGTWIVNSWEIRMPRARTATNPLTQQLATELEGVAVQGGEVLRVHGNDGVVLEAEDGGRIAGIVFDSLQEGLPGARVFIEATGMEVETNWEGRFEMTGLQPGTYSVNFAHPYLDRLSYSAQPFLVEVVEGAGTPAQVNFSAPTIGRAVARLCRDVEATPDRMSVSGAVARSTGILVGRVVDHAGVPLAGALVRVTSRAYGLQADREAEVRDVRMQEERTAVIATTNATGRYLACWVPVDTTLEVAVVEHDDELAPAGLDAVYSPSDLIARTQNTVTVSSVSHFAIFDLRVEQR